jgi:hypothetical protein
MTPLSAHASTDPLLSIAARADTLGKAAKAPRKPIVVVGMWMLLLPFGFASTMAFLERVNDMLEDGFSVAGGIRLVPFALIGFISWGLLIKTTVNYFWVHTERATDDDAIEADAERGEEVADGDDKDPLAPDGDGVDREGGRGGEDSGH